MRKSTLDLLLDNLANLSNRIHAVETAFIDFSEENPKSSDQWQEERLRALEHRCKTLLEIYNTPMPANQVIKADIEYMEAAWKHYEPILQELQAKGVIANPWDRIVELDKEIKGLEQKLDQIQQGKQTQITHLENQVAELGLALGNVSKELQDMKNAR